MIYYIILILLVLVFIGMTIFGALRLNKQQSKFNKEFKKVDDMKSCPNTAKYFAKIQSSYNTWPLAFIASAVFSMVILFLMICINLLSSNKIPEEYIVIITFFVLLGSFTSVYKIENCIMARLCGQESCINPFL